MCLCFLFFLVISVWEWERERERECVREIGNEREREREWEREIGNERERENESAGMWMGMLVTSTRKWCKVNKQNIWVLLLIKYL